jgi:hypothetical protein
MVVDLPPFENPPALKKFHRLNILPWMAFLPYSRYTVIIETLLK